MLNGNIQILNEKMCMKNIDRNNEMSSEERKLIISQSPLIIRAEACPPAKSAAALVIQSEHFKNRDADSAFRFLREAAVYTTQKYLRHPKDTAQNYQARAVSELSQSLQALLQQLDAIQPADTPTKSDDNSLANYGGFHKRLRKRQNEEPAMPAASRRERTLPNSTPAKKTNKPRHAQSETNN